MEPGDQHRVERVVIETTRHRITGLMTLAVTGYRSRVSDVLNATERDFLSLTDALVEPFGSGEGTRHPFVAIARNQIVLAIPERPETPSPVGPAHVAPDLEAG